MAHKVLSVQELHNSALHLYEENVVGGGESSADTILNKLNMGIENLKNNWKGRDAGYRIQEVIGVYNAMINVRNALAELSSESSRVASDYRGIQNANGAGLDSLNVVHFEAKTVLGEYTDNADTVDINVEANNGKQFIDSANNALDSFLTTVKVRYAEIMDNWTEGNGRESAREAFESFITNASNYKQILADVSNNITVALQNYSL